MANIITIAKSEKNTGVSDIQALAFSTATGLRILDLKGFNRLLLSKNEPRPLEENIYPAHSGVWGVWRPYQEKIGNVIEITYTSDGLRRVFDLKALGISDMYKNRNNVAFFMRNDFNGKQPNLYLSTENGSVLTIDLAEFISNRKIRVVDSEGKEIKRGDTVLVRVSDPKFIIAWKGSRNGFSDEDYLKIVGEAPTAENRLEVGLSGNGGNRLLARSDGGEVKGRFPPEYTAFVGYMDLSHVILGGGHNQYDVLENFGLLVEKN